MITNPKVITDLQEMLSAAPCGHAHKAGVQYRMTSEDYDGVSEWRCMDCGKRYGRWTGKELEEGYIEPVYGRGGEPVKVKADD